MNQELSVTVSMEEAMQRKPFAFRRRFDRVDWRKLGEITHAFNLRDASTPRIDLSQFIYSSTVTDPKSHI